jgi:hypothetical protein
VTLWEQVYACIEEKGWRGCLQYAEVWLDEAMPALSKPTEAQPASAIS